MEIDKDRLLKAAETIQNDNKCRREIEEKLYEVGYKKPPGSDQFKKGQSGMSYRDYLGAFLYLQSEETTLSRLMDVMEADIRMTPGNEAFRC